VSPSSNLLSQVAHLTVLLQRAEFGDHHIWVTSHRDNELYSGGHYTNQSNGRAEGIKSWVARKDNVENDDLVLWHTFGLTREWCQLRRVNARLTDLLLQTSVEWKTSLL
jgi:Cu2+-containing amine oxidase